ncbi:iron-sulfur cluster binding protein [Thermodesulfatator indicus DSM 15286]|uniref:Iron-sulfur cluster binding protein n=1 Tax=Thermodesulfatator indicus (strain DSM 15286 / JCM 11887 / CIR29812) TaxID=667014 RepID=F8AE44_THEID|nr:ASKHA domain-containing protein [Thermodesulfatator indicus]AEH44053.1 iron-sulfur cluster binding protein [Thermodesulfatator indicus DSM 15286]
MPDIPVAREIELKLNEPSLANQLADEARVRQKLTEILGEEPKIPLGVLRQLPQVLRDNNFGVKARLLYDGSVWHLAEVLSPRTQKPFLGLGIDLGSTGIVMYLFDFLCLEVIKEHHFKNPQIPFGEDILNRLHFADKPERRKKIHQVTIEALRTETQKLLDDLPENTLYYVAICGNTTMSHFLLNLETRHLYREPYIPAASWIDTLKLSELNLPGHQEGLLFVFPNRGSYFGGDLLAGILATGLHQREEVSILIDVGTNAEVVLGNKDFLLATAGAAGPALEGGILTCGMQAAPGAISRVHIKKGPYALEFETIAGEKPKGLCGSAVIDLLAQMFLAGLIDQRGKFLTEKWPERFKKIEGELAFILVPADESASGKEIYVTQGEIKSIIRSKGAMYTILTVLCQSVGLTFDDIASFYIAGSFGNYIDPEMARLIGMIPDVPLERFKAIGNAAGAGTIAFLKNKDAFRELKKILKNLTYLEMNVQPEFMQLLTGALFLPHTNENLFPNVLKKLNSGTGKN